MRRKTVDLPRSAKYLVIGAGVHGLSTAWHLAKEQRARGEEPDVLIVDKTGVGAGASGIACGVVRNNYYQPAMSELMAAKSRCGSRTPRRSATTRSATSPSARRPGARPDRGARAQQRIGYPSELFVGADEVRRHMREMFPDWRPRASRSACTREGRLREQHGVHAGPGGEGEGGGRAAGRGRAVTGLAMDGSGAVTSVHTDQGDVAVEQVVVGVGPWIASIWKMLGLSDRSTCDARGRRARRPEHVDVLVPAGGGDLGRPRAALAAGRLMPPVLHVDSDAPLYDDEGTLITDELWGNYFKQDLHGVQGGAMPAPVERAADDVRRRYAYSTTEFVVDDDFADMWRASALAFCQKHFEGRHGLLSPRSIGRHRCFAAGQLPVSIAFDENVYVIADSNHGYKMIGVGREVARVIVGRRVEPAAAVPVRALRDGRPAPGLEQPLSLELIRRGRGRRRMVPPAVERDREKRRRLPAHPARAPPTGAVARRRRGLRRWGRGSPRRRRPLLRGRRAPPAVEYRACRPSAGPRPRPPRKPSCAGATCPATTATSAAPAGTRAGRGLRDLDGDGALGLIEHQGHRGGRPASEPAASVARTRGSGGIC